MSSFVGSYVWDASQAPQGWLGLSETVVPERALLVRAAQGTHTFCWEDGPSGTRVRVAHAGTWTVAVVGSLRMRTDVTQRPDPVSYLVDALADGQALKTLLDQFDGEFACIAWDAVVGTIHLATDPVGNHFLYYSLSAGGIMWSSHPQRIARSTGRMDLDPEAMHLYFAIKAIPAPWSILSGVRKIRPGHVLSADRTGVHENEYWPLVDRARQGYRGDFASAQAAVRDLLVSAIQKDAEDVVGACGLFLSGGLDSTALMALSSQIGISTHAFSVGYLPHQRTDETEYARLAAGQLGVPIDLCQVSASESAQVVQDALALASEPANDMALVPQLLLARLMTGQVRVTLDGTGADTVLGGSNKYKAEGLSRFYLRIPGFLRAGIIRPLSNALPASRRWRLTDIARRWQLFVAGCELPEDERRLFWSRFFPDWLIAQVLQPQWRIAPGLSSHCLEDQWRRLQGDDVSATSLMTLRTILPGVELLKHSHLEAMTGISIRKPFLAASFVEFALSLPGAYKVQGDQGKLVLRSAVREIVPQAIQQRPKANFRPPIGEWIGREWQEMFWETLLQDTGLFQFPVVQHLMRDHKIAWRDWSSELWAIFVLQQWWLHATKRDH